MPSLPHMTARVVGQVAFADADQESRGVDVAYIAAPGERATWVDPEGDQPLVAVDGDAGDVRLGFGPGW
ncbi:MAG TPA: hypothetical protein VF070_15710 [Streptosporangiaceae bacterium]